MFPYFLLHSNNSLNYEITEESTKNFYLFMSNKQCYIYFYNYLIKYYNSNKIQYFLSLYLSIMNYNLIYMINCDQCHFEEEKTVCDKCHKGYYLKNNICTNCNLKLTSEGTLCEICSDDSTNYIPEICYCTVNYTQKSSINCVKCPENCYSCRYDSTNDKTKCHQCYEGYTVNSQGLCTSCGENCDSCYINNDGNAICTQCKSGYKLYENNICLDCGYLCEKCIKTKDDTTECTKCIDGYGLDKDKKCIRCPSDCNKCNWNEEKNDFDCTSCVNYYYIIQENDQCVNCHNYNGCDKCYYDNSLKYYKCNNCT